MGTSQCSLWIPWVDPDCPVLTGEKLEELFLLLGLVTLVQNQTDAGGGFVWGLEERKGFQGCHSDSKVARTPVSPSSSLVSCTFVSQSLFLPAGCSARVDFSLSPAEVKAFSLLNKREGGLESFLFYFYLFALKLFFLTSKPIDSFSQCPKPKQTWRAARTDLQTCFY